MGSSSSDHSGADRPKNPFRLKWIPILVVAVLTMVSGVVHGIMDGRWADTENLVGLADKLELAPKQCGNWTLLESKELDEGAEKMLRTYGSIVRIYQHDLTEYQITVAILLGPRGPIAVHTPEVCYSSTGTRQLEARKRENVYNGNQFWSVKFEGRNSSNASFEVWYGWSDGGKWKAAEQPRFWLTDNLYKLQIAGPRVESETFQPCEDFLNSFLPEIETLIE